MTRRRATSALTPEAVWASPTLATLEGPLSASSREAAMALASASSSSIAGTEASAGSTDGGVGTVDADSATVMDSPFDMPEDEHEALSSAVPISFGGNPALRI